MVGFSAPEIRLRNLNLFGLVFICTLFTFSPQSYGGETTAVSCTGGSEDCNSSCGRANFLCMQSLSPTLTTGMQVASAIVASPLLDSTSPKDQCESGLDANSVLKASFGAYMAACEGAKLLCENTCTTWEKKKIAEADDYDKAANTVRAENPSAAAAYTEAAKNARAVAAADKVNHSKCQANAVNLAMAAANLAQVVKSESSSSSCNKATTATATGTTSTGTTDSTKALDCTVAANVNTEYCGCARNPLLAKCAEVSPNFAAIQSRLSGRTTSKDGTTSGLDLGNIDALAAGANLSDDSASSGGSAKRNDASSSSGFAPVGTLGADGSGSGMSGTAGKAGPNTPEANKKSLLSGEEGGGRSSARSGSSSINEDMRKRINDMKRKIASQDLGKQITGANGKNIFQKINESFGRSEKSLLNDRKL